MEDRVPYDKTKDSFASSSASFSAPARQCVLVTPSDSQDLAVYAKALRIYVPTSVAGGVATVKVTPLQAANDADTVTLRVPPGISVEPLAVRQVWSTGTSAGIDIHAFTM
jgi:hypothetical protein